MSTKIVTGKKIAARLQKQGVKLDGITWGELAQRIDWLLGGAR